MIGGGGLRVNRGAWTGWMGAAGGGLSFAMSRNAVRRPAVSTPISYLRGVFLTLFGRSGYDAGMMEVPGYRILGLKSQDEGKFVGVTAEALSGGLPERADAVLFPGGRLVRIKSAVLRGGRAELMIKGAPRSALRSGTVLAGRDWPVQESREALLVPVREAGEGGERPEGRRPEGEKGAACSAGGPPSDAAGAVRGGAAGGGDASCRLVLPSGTQKVRGGAFRDFNREGLVGGARFRGEGALVRVRFPSAYPLMPGTDLNIIDDCGVPRRFRVLLGDGCSGESAKRLAAAARAWGSRGMSRGKRAPERWRKQFPISPGSRAAGESTGRAARKASMRPPHRHVARPIAPPPEPGAIFTFLLKFNGFIRLPPGFAADELRGLPQGLEHAGDWTLLSEWRRKMDRLLIRGCSRPGGAAPANLRIEGTPESLIKVLLVNLARRGLAIERNGWFFPAGEPPLSPFHRSWLHRVEDAGSQGIRLRTISSQADREALEALGRSGLIHGGDTLWLSRRTVSEAAAKIRRHCPRGKSVTAAEIRQFFGGSRVVRMELAAALEAEGVFKLQPDGITRLVL